MTEQSVVLIKPDGVRRGLVGEILHRFEKVGIKIVAMKMIWVEADLVGKHYSDNKEYLTSIGTKTLESYQKYGKDPKEEIGTMDPLEIGKIVRKWNMEYVTSGPVIALLLEAPGVVEIVRKIVGSTFPQSAPPGTIRGDYSFDSSFLSNDKKRSVKNLIHASGTPEEGQFERQLWFKENEIYSYKRIEEAEMLD